MCIRDRPDTRYKALDAQYAKEQDALEIEIAELEKAVTGYEPVSYTHLFNQGNSIKFLYAPIVHFIFEIPLHNRLISFVEKCLISQATTLPRVFHS